MWGTKEYFAPELLNRAYGPQVTQLLIFVRVYPRHSSLPSATGRGCGRRTCGVWDGWCMKFSRARPLLVVKMKRKCFNI